MIKRITLLAVVGLVICNSTVLINAKNEHEYGESVKIQAQYSFNNNIEESNANRDIKTHLEQDNDVLLNQQYLELNVGESFQLIETDTSSSIPIQSLLWTTDNPKAVTVDDTGLVNGISEGSANISAQTESGDIVVVCTVEVHNWETIYTVDRDSTIEEQGQQSIHCAECNKIKDDSICSIPTAEEEIITCGERPFELGFVFQYGQNVQTRQIDIENYQYFEYLCEEVDAFGFEEDILKVYFSPKGGYGSDIVTIQDTVNNKVIKQYIITCVPLVEEKKICLNEYIWETVWGYPLWNTTHDEIDGLTITYRNSRDYSEPYGEYGSNHTVNYTETVYTVKADKAGEYTVNYYGDNNEPFKTVKYTVSENHNYVTDKITKKSTCFDDGEIVKKCTICGNTITETIPSTGHNFGEWIVTKEATCTEYGEETRVCANDSTHTEIRTVNKLSHDLTHVEAKAPTCTEDGNIEYYECGVCGKKYEDEEGTTEITIDVVLPKTGHDWSEWTVTKEATCTEDGEETRTCANDPPHTETRTVEKLGHAMTHVEVKDPTCTEDGNIEYYECGNCGKKFVDEEGTTEITTDAVLPKTEHSFGEWIVTKESTCTEGGEETRTCANDPTHTETRTVEKLGHAMTHVEAKVPTCTEDGNIEYYECGNCGKKFADEEGTTEITTDVVLPATGHTPEEGWNADSSYHFHKCEVCGEPVEETKEAHTWTEWEKDLSVGTQTRKCTVCGYTETKALPTGAWKQDSTGWWYDNGDGTYPKNEIKTISGKDYYFNGSGYMATGWQQINGKWYVFDSSGAMKKNAWEGNYWLGVDGAMATNSWVDSKKYYVGADGKWIPDYGVAKWKQDSTGWWYDNGDGTYPHGEFKTIDGTEYYFKENGYMATGWTQINGKWYVFNSSGAMKKNAWEGNYYLKEDGTMAVSEWVCNNQYYVGADGAWIPDYGVAKWKQDSTGWWYDNGDGTYAKNEFKTIDGTTYYFNASGYMVTGWTSISGNWYFFENSGAMKRNSWKDKYWLGTDGIMATNSWVDNGNYYVGPDGIWTTSYYVASRNSDVFHRYNCVSVHNMNPSNIQCFDSREQAAANHRPCHNCNP